MNLQMIQEKEHVDDLFEKNCPKWETADPEQSIIDIMDYFVMLQSTYDAHCSYILHKNIVPDVNRGKRSI